MEHDQLRDKWPEMQLRIMQQYPSLKQEDLVYEIGKEAELLKRLQEKLGKNRQEIDNWLSLMG